MWKSESINNATNINPFHPIKTNPNKHVLKTVVLKQVTDVLKQGTDALKQGTDALKRGTDVLAQSTDVLKAEQEEQYCEKWRWGRAFVLV